MFRKVTLAFVAAASLSAAAQSPSNTVGGFSPGATTSTSVVGDDPVGVTAGASSGSACAVQAASARATTAPSASTENRRGIGVLTSSASCAGSFECMRARA